MSGQGNQRQPETAASRLREVALLFLRIGATAFGGPAAYIAIMRREVVGLRLWLDDQTFLDLVGAVNLIPGPNATEMAIYVGQLRAGWRGLITAGVLFTLPGMLFTLAIAWVYVTYGALPEVSWVLYGIKPVVIAIIVQALWELGRKGIKGPISGMVGAGVLALYLLGLNEILVLFAGAAVFVLAKGGYRLWKGSAAAIIAIFPAVKVSWLPLVAGAVPFSQTALFLAFLKIGAVLYGSGYVLLAFLDAEFVTRLGWLTGQQVLDAIAAGQVTPGPLFTSATFVGYLMGGWSSALLATLAIFLPSFLFIGLLHHLLPRLRRSAWAGAFLDGVNVAALGLMAGALWRLGKDGIVDVFTIVLTIITLFLVFRFKFNSAWLILGGGVLGVIYRIVAGGI